MALTEEDKQAIDQALQAWRQGDVSLGAGLEFLHLVDLSRPHSPASVQAAKAAAEGGETISAVAAPVLDESLGMLMLSQTCEIVRDCRARPFVEVAPLVAVSEPWLDGIRRLKRPAFTFVPATADARLVSDLDRVMTVEKALVAEWPRIPGWRTDEELRDFARSLARKRSRFAFPDDFVAAVSRLLVHMVGKHNKQTDEGAHLRALREIRVRAAPSWDADKVQLSWWFVKDDDPPHVSADWPALLDRWLALFKQGEGRRFRFDAPIVCRLDDMTARDYVDSDRLDLDRLSNSPRFPSLRHAIAGKSSHM